MNRRSYTIILLLIIMILYCMLSLYPAFAKSKEPIELSIIFDKDKYQPKDQIKIKFSFKNSTREPIYINKRFFVNSEDSDPKYREVYLVVVSPSGEKLSFKPSIDTGLPRTEDFVLLPPGDEVTSDREKQIKHYFDFSEEGKYEITAVYKNVYGEEIGLDAYKKEVVSKPVDIVIGS